MLRRSCSEEYTASSCITLSCDIRDAITALSTYSRAGRDNPGSAFSTADFLPFSFWSACFCLWWYLRFSSHVALSTVSTILLTVSAFRVRQSASVVIGLSSSARSAVGSVFFLRYDVPFPSVMLVSNRSRASLHSISRILCLTNPPATQHSAAAKAMFVPV
jgi:hypothetical protein